MVEARDFKGIWIPKEVYLNNELTWTEKLLFAEIDSLDGEDGCFATNEYFSNFLGVSKTIVSIGISKLKKMGLVEQTNFDGRTRVLKTKAGFKQTLRQGLRKLKGRVKENLNPDNNKIITKNDNIDYNTLSPKGSGEIAEQDVLDKWNAIADRYTLSRIICLTKDRKKKLESRLKQTGFSLEEFFNRIDDKISKSTFLRGKKMAYDGNGQWRLENADWCCGFDFFLQPSSLQKTLEDRYTDRTYLQKPDKQKVILTKDS